MNENNYRYLNIVASILLIFFSLFVIKELSSILIPFVLALIISFVFEPFLTWMKSKKIPGAIGIVIIILCIILIANIVSLFIFSSINTFASGFKVYETKLINLFNSFVQFLNLTPEEQKNLSDSFKLSYLLQQGSITSFILGIITGFLGIFGDFVLIIFYVIFILAEFESIQERIRLAFPETRAESIIVTTNTIFRDVRKYISGKTIISAVLGILSGLLMWMFGVEFSFIWGFLIFLMHFIPTIGALIAISLPAIVMLLQFDNIFTPVLVTALLIVLQNVIGNIVEPRVLGIHLNVSPLLLLLSLFIGSYVWGIVGMILSVPIVSMLKIILMNFEATRPIAILMSYKRSFIKDNIFKLKPFGR